MDRPRLTFDDIAQLAGGASPENTNGMDCEEAITALAQELLPIRRASEGIKSLMGLTRWSPKGLPKNRGGVCMGVAKKGEWINRKEALIALGALRLAPAEVEE